MTGTKTFRVSAGRAGCIEERPIHLRQGSGGQVRKVVTADGLPGDLDNDTTDYLYAGEEIQPCPEGTPHFPCSHASGQ